MNKKIIVAVTASVLATAGLFAAVKKLTATAIYAKNVNGTGTCTLITSGTVPPAFTNVAGTNQATIKSTAGTQYRLFSTSTCGSSHKVYFL